jgi:hypothetical protein
LKSFAEFLDERVVRTPERAHKLASNLAKRYASKDFGGHMVFKNKTSDFSRTAKAAWAAHRSGLKKYPVTRERMAIKDISHTQNYLDTDHLHHHIDHQGQHGPVTVIRHRGRNWAVDGHHRLTAAGINGETHHDAEVIHVPDHEDHSKPLSKPSVWQRIKQHYTS